MFRFFGVAGTFALLITASASAETKYPDLRGTWTGQADAVFVAPASKSRIGENAEKQPAVFGSAPFTLIIEKQKDRRFSGIVTVKASTKPVVGAVFINGRIRWAEPGGVVEAELTGRNTLETCYMRGTEFSQMVSCATLKREK